MSYTALEVDELNSKFEKCGERQETNKSSVVRLRAAERDLLAVAEAARDLLLKAVKGDKGLLSEVFGGNCIRFHRFRRVLDTVELSDMHSTDKRWSDLKTAMDIIEDVLKQLGLFKPWQIGKKAPEKVIYKGLRKRYAPGEQVQLMPEIEGGDPTGFTVEPALPDGLVLNSATGMISGQLRPGTEIPEQIYLVTAKNDIGQSEVQLVFAVSPPAPASLEYPRAGDVVTGQEVNWEPAITGGAPKEWLVTPDLPSGMSIDSAGVITGSPTDSVAKTGYVITAKNASGEVSVSIGFGVKMAAPEAIVYAEAQTSYSQGFVIYLVPEVTLATDKQSASWLRVRSLMLKRLHVAAQLKMNFSVEPALPSGIVLSAKTGVITGKSDVPVSEANYTVTVSNESGKASVNLTFGIKVVPPSSLSYPDAEKTYFTGHPVSLSPTVEGMVSDWQVEPALPTGLFFDSSMGIIQGIPTEVLPAGTWTVTARNAEGAATASLSFSVQRASPSNLSYPALTEDLPRLRAVTLQPSVEGEVNTFAVSPALPAGLELDSTTGELRGTPTTATATAKYEVTATNETGSASTVLEFCVKVMPPEALWYPQVDDVYCVGELISLEPEVEGWPTIWAVDPPFPKGMIFDESSGQISGSPEQPAGEISYVVTASNEAGGTSAVLTFGITAPRPSGLSYPTAGNDYLVGHQMLLEPALESGVCATFIIEPTLPAGLLIDPSTGVIGGTPTDESPSTTYKVTAKNVAGSTDAEITFAVTKEVEEETGVDQKFAEMIQEITDIADMVAEPNRMKCLGDWMVWMVHRAWLNDPTLTDFNFNNLNMPLPHLEPRIAPKLMKAMEHNTCITSLQVAHSNLQKPQGHQLSEALRKNTTLKILNIESNSLDSDAVKAIAVALQENDKTGLEQWRFNNQKHLGAYFGRPVEQAIAEMIDKNTRILKLGFACQDPNWRLIIDRAVLRNNDYARRRRKGSIFGLTEDEIKAEDRTLSKLTLTNFPDKAVWEVFEDDDKHLRLARSFVHANKRLPTKEQLQNYGKSVGQPLAYSAVAPLIKDFRTKLMNSVVGHFVSVEDSYGVHLEGSLRTWSEKNERWTLDVWPSGDSRLNCTADKQPIIEVSPAFAQWIEPGETH